MHELIEIFTEIKNNLYNRSNQKYSFIKLYKIINKKNKTDKENMYLKKLFICVNKMKQILSNLGTRLFNITIDEYKTKYSNVILFDNMDGQLKELVVLIDKFIEGLKIFNNFYIDKDSFKIKKTLYYLIEVRNYLYKNILKYSKLLLKNEIEENKLKRMLNDVIDIFIQKGYKLEVIKLYNVLKGIYKK